VAADPVALAVGHEGEVARPQEAGLGALDLEPAAANVHDVEPQGVRLGRQRQPPGCAQLGADVEGAGHPQHVQRRAQGIGCGPRVLASHADSVATGPAVRPWSLDDWA
jgi:hypothetical protein